MLQHLLRFAARYSFLLLAGCQAVTGLDNFEIDRPSAAGASGSAAGGVKSDAGQPTSTTMRMPTPKNTSQAREPQLQGMDAGVAIKVKEAALADAAVGGGATSAPADAGTSADDDAGVGSHTTMDVNLDVDKVLGQTGLRVSDILGYYSGDWGQMVLRAHGDEIWGVYQYRDGTITGHVNDEGVFIGWWTQLPSRTGMDEGDVEFRWSRIANSTIALDGRWRYGSAGDWLENWDITRVTTQSAPSYLTDRFEATGDFKHRP